MFAVIRTGGKQYRVAENDMIVVETLPGEPGSTVRFEEVLMIGDDGAAPSVGAPVLDQAAVFAEVVQQTRGDKIIVFKKKRRKGYRRKHGHRQALTVLRITGISATGKKAEAKAKARVPAGKEGKAKPAAKPKTEPKPKVKAKPKTAAKPKQEAKPKPAAKPRAKPAPGKAAAGAAKPKTGAKASAKSKE